MVDCPYHIRYVEGIFLLHTAWGMPLQTANRTGILKLKLKYLRTSMPFELQPAGCQWHHARLMRNGSRERVEEIRRCLNDLGIDRRSAVSVPIFLQGMKFEQLQANLIK